MTDPLIEHVARAMAACRDLSFDPMEDARAAIAAMREYERENDA